MRSRALPAQARAWPLLLILLVTPVHGEEGETCVDCHAEFIPELTRQYDHEPFAGGDCEACHVYHGYREQMELGSDTIYDLCAECHVEAVDLPEDNVHSPLTDDESCLTCHVPHSADHEKLLKAPTAELCLDCHDGPDDASGVIHAPFEEKACTDCHDPHGSLFPSFLKLPVHYVCMDCHFDVIGDAPPEEMHGFSQERFCDRCHRGHAAEEDKLLVSALPILCTDCHEELAGGSDRERLHSALTDGSCLDCHQAHFRSGDALLQPAPALCFECHDEIRDRLGLPTPHDAAEDCSSCHDPHERIATGTEPELCSECHDLEDEDFLGGHFSLTPDRCTGCHEPHGTTAASLIRPFEHAPFADRECDTCHDDSDPERLRSGDLCLDCHDEPEPGGAHAPERRGGRTCVACHTPHAADAPGLIDIRD